MSASPSNTFERLFPNRLDDLGIVTEELMQFIADHGVDAEPAYAVNLAVEEMVTNILKYGYDDKNEHQILLRLEVLPDKLVLTIEDDGHEFDPLKAEAPPVHLPGEMREVGGLGIHLVKEMAAEMKYERVGGRNRLVITIARSR